MTLAKEVIMKCLKVSGLAVVAVVAFMAWIGAAGASATVLDCNGVTCSPHTTIHIVSEGKTVIHPPIGDIECNTDTYHFTLTNPGAIDLTSLLQILGLTTSECNATISVLATGTWEIHTKTASSDNNGTITSSGTEITIEFVGFHCIFKTSNTDLGTFTGSANTGGNATIDMSGSLPRTGGRSGAFCGSTAQVTGSFKVTSPTSMNVT